MKLDDLRKRFALKLYSDVSDECCCPQCKGEADNAWRTKQLRLVGSIMSCLSCGVDLRVTADGFEVLPKGSGKLVDNAWLCRKCEISYLDEVIEKTRVSAGPLCCPYCQSELERDPSMYVVPAAPAFDTRCPACGGQAALPHQQWCPGETVACKRCNEWLTATANGFLADRGS